MMHCQRPWQACALSAAGPTGLGLQLKDSLISLPQHSIHVIVAYAAPAQLMWPAETHLYTYYIVVYRIYCVLDKSPRKTANM